MDQFRGLRTHPILCRLISSCGNTLRTSLDELKLRIVAAIETATPQILNTWREIEYRLDILRVKKGANVEVVSHSAVFISKLIKHFEFHFHITSIILFSYFRFENYWLRNSRQQFRITVTARNELEGFGMNWS
jgi:hypothetical protein